MAIKRRLDHDQTSDGHAHPRDVSLDAALDALGDPIRRSIVRQLASEPDWTKPCGSFDLPVTNGTLSHHFATLRRAGLIEQRPDATRRLNRLRRPEFDQRFPGLLDLVINESGA
ncbi:MAG TPA: ArsR family transcriptional regulator [Solirubrobacteraceae bacterium]|nr:ArsR family transcriptional regulator [Solirubrobacteraceae bacterium]